jgi:hypothetical protein
MDMFKKLTPEQWKMRKKDAADYDKKAVVDKNIPLTTEVLQNIATATKDNSTTTIRKST